MAVQSRARGSADLKSVLACFPLKTWSYSEEKPWPDFTSLSLFRFAFFLGHFWENDITHHFQPGNSPVLAHVYACMILVIHLAEGRHRAVLNLACISCWKRIIYNSSSTFCLFVSSKKGELTFVTSSYLSVISAYFFDFREWDLDIKWVISDFYFFFSWNEDEEKQSPNV